MKDQVQAYASLISCLGQEGRLQQAINVGTRVLRRQLGESMPQQVGKFAAKLDVMRLKQTLRGRSNDALLRLPLMSDNDKIAAMYIMTTLLPYACQAGSNYTDLIARKLVGMFLKYGFHKGCALGFTKLAFFLCESHGNEGYRLGNVALSIVERSGAREFIPRGTFVLLRLYSSMEVSIEREFAALGTRRREI